MFARTDTARTLVEDSLQQLNAQHATQLVEAQHRSGQTSMIELSQAPPNALEAEIGVASAKLRLSAEVSTT